MFKKKQETEFNIGDKLFYYYKFPNQEPYNGQYGVVSFYVKRIYVNKEISEERVSVKEMYEGSSIGCNYYGIADADMCAKSVEELTVKLLKKGYTLLPNKEENNMKYPDFRKAPEGATHWDTKYGGFWCNVEEWEVL